MLRHGRSALPWVVAAVAIVLGVGGAVSFARRLSTTVPEIGVGWGQTPGGAVAVRVDPAGAAQAAGLRPGDRLERIDGREVRSVLDARSIAWELEARGSLRLDVRRGDAPVAIRLPAPPRTSAVTLQGFLALVGVGFFLSGLLVALRWPGVRGGMAYSLFAAAAFTELTFSHTGRADLLDWTIWWADVVAGAAAPALLVHLAILLSRRVVPARRLAVVLAYVPTAGILGAAVWLLAFGGALRLPDPVRAVESLDRAALLFLAFAVVSSVALLARAHATSGSALHRSQCRWMLWGLSIGLTPFGVMYALPWALGADVPAWAELSAFPLVLVPAAFTASLARYRLHDLDMLLRRGVSEVAAAFAVVAAYAMGVEVLRRGLGGILPLTPAGFRYPAIVVAAAMYPKLRTWTRSAVDRAFYRQRYSYRVTLLDWARELSAEVDLAKLLATIRDRVRETLSVQEARVLLLREDGRFADPSGDPSAPGIVLPPRRVEELEAGRHVSAAEGEIAGLSWARHLFGMKVKGRLRALLAVGERGEPDRPLSTEDRALVATLAAHAATAIEAARLVREVRAHAEQVEELKASQERILESSGVGLLLMDADGTILAWNRALETMYGLPRGEAIGRRIEDVFPLHAVRKVQREILAGPAGEECRIWRYNLVNRSGRRLVVNLTASPVEPSREGGIARVVTFDDVTDQVKLEEQLLRQERLASLGLLAAGVAHEVNTPLTGISSYTQMLLEEMPADDPRRGILEKIEAQSRRASSIANSLLNLVRPERAPFESLSLDVAIGEVLRLFEPQIRERGIRLETDLHADLPLVHGDKGKLQQVLLNLLLNARDAVGDGGSVRVSTYARGGSVVLEVLDDGVGIAEEDLSRIFDPFFTTKGRGKGTGLGLSISHGIVREHGGEMHVESSPGEFTRFRVEIPAGQPARALA